MALSICNLGLPADERRGAWAFTGVCALTGQPDSIFNSFVAFLTAHGHWAISIDQRTRRVTARLKNADGTINFEFKTWGDSTTVTAQGPKGGGAGLRFVLGVVNDWLEANPAAKPDTAH